MPNYMGRAPNCRPECTLDAECPSNLACRDERCQNPCSNVCGVNAICSVLNHSPSCTCIPGYEGDPFSQCREILREQRKIN
jgi:hypothetical protein